MSVVEGSGAREHAMEAVAERVADGTYRVDAHDVADAILERWNSDWVAEGALRDWYAIYSEDAGAAPDSSD